MAAFIVVPVLSDPAVITGDKCGLLWSRSAHGIKLEKLLSGTCSSLGTHEAVLRKNRMFKSLFHLSPTTQSSKEILSSVKELDLIKDSSSIPVSIKTRCSSLFEWQGLVASILHKLEPCDLKASLLFMVQFYTRSLNYNAEIRSLLSLGRCLF